MRKAKLILVDDDRNLLRVLTYQIKELGFSVVPLSSGKEALQRLRDDSYDLVITDLRMPEMDGLELLRRIRALSEDIPVIVLTAYGSIDKAVEAVKLGASDFLSKPFEKVEIQHAITKALELADLKQENRRLSEAVSQRFEFDGLIGSSKSFQETIEMATQLVDFNSTVLITGESGTGKELMARAVHYNSRRRNQPFIVVNCGAIPSELMESELFGYQKGAFTGAATNRKGKFEVASGGTVFLDEVGELPLNMQVKLLRVLQEKEIDVLGDPLPRAVDVRIVAATNRDLFTLLQEGSFREDLYYRLSVAPLHIPPLRERVEDIPLLTHFIMGKLKQRLEKEVAIDEKVIEAFQRYGWPGNVRELENLLERLVVFNRTGTITRGELPAHLRQPVEVMGTVQLQLPDAGFSLEALERDILLAALKRHDWNQSRAARYLGITRNTLIYRMQKFDLKKGGSHETLDT